MKRYLILMLLLICVPVFAQRKLTTNEATILSVGPFFDSTDGITPETSIDVTGLTVEIYRENDAGTVPTRFANFVPTASGGSNDMALITNSVSGVYSLEITAAQVNFTGPMMLSIVDTDSAGIVGLPFWRYINLTSANVVDAEYGTDNLQVDTTQIEGGDASNALDTALSDINLDVLIKSGVSSFATDVNSDSVIGYMVVGSSTADYVRATDSLEDLRDHITDRSLADIDYFLFGTDVVVTDSDSRTASKATGFAVSGEPLTAAEVNAEVDTALDTAIPASPTKDSINDRIKTGIIDIIESQRERHTIQGDIFYVDPVNGATHGSGARGGRADPYLTIQDCHDNAVTAWAHDVIMLIAGDTNSSTTHSVAATTTISKAYTFIRGPGRDFIITRTGAGDTISITGDGVQISGVQIGTAATGSGDGIDITDADFTRVRYCWFLDTQGDGIHILKGTNGRYHHNHFDGTGVGGTGQGIHIVGTGGSSNDNAIFDNHFANTAGDSILIEQGVTNDTSIHHNQIHNAGGWAINIGGSSTDALVHDNFFGNNSSGDVNDGGTDTIQINNEQWAKHSIATETRLAELDAGNLPTDIANIPTVSEFNARTLVTADYFLFGSDRVILSAATETQIDNIESDTNELQTDWTNGGRLDLIIDIIQAYWDSLTITDGLLEVIHGNI